MRGSTVLLIHIPVLGTLRSLRSEDTASALDSDDSTEV